jgi:hypothetical protein
MALSRPHGLADQGPPERPRGIDGWVWSVTGVLALLDWAAIVWEPGLLLILPGISCCGFPWLACLPSLLRITGVGISWFTVVAVTLILLVLSFINFYKFLDLCAAC